MPLSAEERRHWRRFRQAVRNKIADLETAGYRIVDSYQLGDGRSVFVDYQTRQHIGVIGADEELPGNWVHIDDVRSSARRDA